MYRRIVLTTACAAMFGCGLSIGPDRTVPKPAAPVPAVAETPAWSLNTLRQQGFVANSTLAVTIGTGTAAVDMTDTARMSLMPGGDFSFSRTRSHKGGPDGVSEETFSAVRARDSYYTAGSSGQWVRWDDALTQPGAMVESFISGEDAILSIVHDCGRPGAPDEAGRVPVSLQTEMCEFETETMPAATKAYSGKLKSLAGHMVMNGNTPVEAAFEIEFVSSFGGVETLVRLNYGLKVEGGGPGQEVKAPEAFLESRRPRPVRMVDSVLSDMVDEWGPGAPGVLRKKTPGSGR